MSVFATRLRQRARQLHLPDAEIAHRAGLSERRYGHYVRGLREPDFATFLRICTALGLTPNELLLPAEPRHQSVHDRWVFRLTSVGWKLDTQRLRLTVRLVEVLLEMKVDKVRGS
jgi:transcriptional regulator with XRE-family HTH domain